MNNIFNPSRFGNYFAYVVKSGYKSALLAFVATLGALLISIVLPVIFNGYPAYKYSDIYAGEDPLHSRIETTLYFGLFIACAAGAALMFRDLMKKEGRISSLMLPASQFEKYLVKWLIFIPFVLVAYFVAFELADIIRYIVVSAKYPGTVNLHLFDLFGSLRRPDKYMWAFLVLTQSVFCLGGIIWPKLPVSNTLLALFTIGLVFFFYTMWIANALFNEPNTIYGFENGRLEYDLGFLGIYLLALVCYILSYFRYKEIEIIQRW